MGAAPETMARALLNPRAFLNLRLSIPDRIGIRMSLLSFSSGSFASIPVWNLVQIPWHGKKHSGLCVLKVLSKGVEAFGKRDRSTKTENSIFNHNSLCNMVQWQIGEKIIFPLKSTFSGLDSNVSTAVLELAR